MRLSVRMREFSLGGAAYRGDRPVCARGAIGNLLIVVGGMRDSINLSLTVNLRGTPRELESLSRIHCAVCPRSRFDAILQQCVYTCDSRPATLSRLHMRAHLLTLSLSVWECASDNEDFHKGIQSRIHTMLKNRDDRTGLIPPTS